MYRHTTSITACVLALTALGSTPASAINTFGSWNGANAISPFGCPHSTTYGQVITVNGKTTLSKFSFSWIYQGENGGSMVMRGEVYKWNGSRAKGNALWESKPITISYTDNAFHTQNFKPGALELTDGEQYVLFATIDRDYAQCTNGYAVGWAAVDDSVYNKGEFVFQNNMGDASLWTTTAWQTFNLDLGFKAVLD
jgi:hypothetical protein